MYLFEEMVLCVFACICYNADTGLGLFCHELLFVAPLTSASFRLRGCGSEWKVG